KEPYHAEKQLSNLCYDWSSRCSTNSNDAEHSIPAGTANRAGVPRAARPAETRVRRRCGATSLAASTQGRASSALRAGDGPIRLTSNLLHAMLRFLSIKRLAVIDSVEVEFDAGLNVLTGETGAGKSILVEAVGLLLGG